MEPELKEVLGLLLRKSWFIGLLAAVFCGAVYYYHDNYAVPNYLAVSKIIVHSTSESVMIDTYKEIMTTPVVMEPVVAAHPELGLTAEELGGRVQVGTSEKSQVMSISVTDPSPEKAAAIVSAVAETFKSEIPKVIPVDKVSILSDSGSAAGPRNIAQGVVSKLMIAFVLSVMASVGLILLREYFDDKIRTEKDAAKALGRPVLGAVTRIRKSDFRTSAARSASTEATKKSKAGETLNVGINQQA